MGQFPHESAEICRGIFYLCFPLLTSAFLLVTDVSRNVCGRRTTPISCEHEKSPFPLSSLNSRKGAKDWLIPGTYASLIPKIGMKKQGYLKAIPPILVLTNCFDISLTPYSANFRVQYFVIGASLYKKLWLICF